MASCVGGFEHDFNVQPIWNMVRMLPSDELFFTYLAWAETTYSTRFFFDPLFADYVYIKFGDFGER
jgi:hypothetical protein